MQRRRPKGTVVVTQPTQAQETDRFSTELIMLIGNCAARRQTFVYIDDRCRRQRRHVAM